MKVEEMVSFLDTAVSEIELSITTKDTKSEWVREHYLECAMHYILEVKHALKKEDTECKLDQE